VINNAVEALRVKVDKAVHLLAAELDNMSALTPAKRMLALDDLMGPGMMDGDRVKEFLTQCRKSRNRTAVTERIQKQCGSVYGAQMPFPIDTALKIHYQVCEANKCEPVVEGNVVRVYGAKYRMMMPVLDRLPGDVRYHDVVHNPEAPAAYSQANVLDINDGDFVFDAHHASTLKAKTANLTGKPVGYRVDLAKMERFITLTKTKFISSAMSLSTFVSKHDYDKACDILFPRNAPQPFPYVRLMKFGKLHNMEVHLVLSRQKGRPVRSVGQFKADVRNCFASVLLANKGIQYADAVGLRMIDSRSKICSRYWHTLLKALPIRWDHYFDNPPQGDTCIQGGGVGFVTHGSDGGAKVGGTWQDEVVEVYE